MSDTHGIPTAYPAQPEATTPPVMVAVDSIMNQIHEHWARLMADQIQRNAELTAALNAATEELTETKGKLAALTAASGLG